MNEYVYAYVSTAPILAGQSRRFALILCASRLLLDRQRNIIYGEFCIIIWRGVVSIQKVTHIFGGNHAFWRLVCMCVCVCVCVCVCLVCVYVMYSMHV